MPIGPLGRHRNYRHYLAGIRNLYKKKQTKVYTGIVLSILTVAFFSFFAIRPTLVTIGGLLKEVKDKKEIVTQLDQKVNALAQAQTNYNQIESRLYLIDQSLPQDPSLSTLIKELEFLSQSSLVTLESLKFDQINLQGESEKKESQEASFTLAVSGDYSILKNFLNSLDILRRITLIDNFAFKSKIVEETQALVLTVNAKAHYLIKSP